MADNIIRIETCAKCGQPPTEGRVFCHVYEGPECVTLCSAKCALDFVEGSLPVGAHSNGHRSLDAIMDDLRWQHYGH
ncbi:hypothetical protein [Horticoccus sp. 23ND18S-11]|uniref:hypothetical protein n=1 Tax=Horticoccus sp. 23ND18S-11 TaxID=3391832 RepID=UPI0039C92B60